MKNRKTLMVILALLSIAAVQMTPTPITLAWNPQPDADAYYVYASTNVAAPMPWAPITNTPALVAPSVTIQPVPSRMFYYVTASNFWGESGPSNTIGTPAVVTNSSLSIRKGN